MIKLLSVWVGPLPNWFPQFKQRMDNQRIDWELYHAANVGEITRRITRVTHLLCRKKTAYACCDLRPMYGEMFKETFRGYRWWGWCDLDIIVGDLFSLLFPHLDSNDVISSDSGCVSGGMTILRNCEEVNTLWRSSPWRSIINNPHYCNFDEGQNKWSASNSYGFSGLVKQNLRYHFSDLSWHEGRDMLGRVPSRKCELRGNKLIETPTEREILLYHLGSKKWPLDSDGKWVRQDNSY